jgi:hypothetical protein
LASRIRRKPLVNYARKSKTVTKPVKENAMINSVKGGIKIK